MGDPQDRFKLKILLQDETLSNGKRSPSVVGSALRFREIFHAMTDCGYSILRRHKTLRRQALPFLLATTRLHFASVTICVQLIAGFGRALLIREI